MKNEWYADDKDVLKWGALLHLAAQHSLNHLFYVATFRGTWPQAPAMHVNGQPVALPTAAWNHFRTIKGVGGLTAVAQLQSTIIDRPFAWHNGFPNSAAAREDYFVSAAQMIAQHATPALVFVDPDNGIAPENPTWEHVLPAELTTLFASMSPKSILAVYQHCTHANEWIETARNTLAVAAGKAVPDVLVLTSPIAGDAAMLAVSK